MAAPGKAVSAWWVGCVMYGYALRHSHVHAHQIVTAGGKKLSLPLSEAITTRHLCQPLRPRSLLSGPLLTLLSRFRMVSIHDKSANIFNNLFSSRNNARRTRTSIRGDSPRYLYPRWRSSRLPESYSGIKSHDMQPIYVKVAEFWRGGSQPRVPNEPSEGAPSQPNFVWTEPLMPL